MEGEDIPRELRPNHQLFGVCAVCKDQFKSGDSIYFTLNEALPRPICNKCSYMLTGKAERVDCEHFRKQYPLP